MPSPSASPGPRRRMPRWLLVSLIVVIAIVLVGGIAIVGTVVTRAVQTLTATPPGVGTVIVVPDESKAAKAVTAGGTPDQVAAASYLAAQPTAYWLTPEIDPIGEVWDRVAHLAAEARAQKAALAVVVYGLPGRDCGNHSAGGLDEADYLTWTGQIGQALANAQDVQKIVVLEPDSLGLAPNCGNMADRTRQLTAAVDRIDGVNTWIYLDGGHSQWHSADEMAGIIRQTGLIGRVRGVALNVSNYNETTQEFAYAHALSSRLDGTHAIVDTGRNGAGALGSVWCNPPQRLIGDPGGTYGDDVVDTNLWIKPPGESDGECNGGPPAGVWWPTGAASLTRNVR